MIAEVARIRQTGAAVEADDAVVEIEFPAEQRGQLAEVDHSAAGADAELDDGHAFKAEPLGFEAR